jgi:hypothetical protein
LTCLEAQEILWRKNPRWLYHDDQASALRLVPVFPFNVLEDLLVDIHDFIVNKSPVLGFGVYKMHRSLDGLQRELINPYGNPVDQTVETISEYGKNRLRTKIFQMGD